MIERPTLDEKERCLKERLKALGSVLVAYSGGTDSTLLLSVAREMLGDRAHALVAVSAVFPQRETDRARAIVGELGVPALFLPMRHADAEAFAANPEDRCYHCKAELMRRCRAVADERGLAHVADGTNVDDFADYRPGTKAKEEAGAVSPLADCGFTKADVRLLSTARNLPTADLPSMACLASRFPYGTRITDERLRQVEACEEILAAEGFVQYRVRYHGEIARIEVPEAEIPRLLDGERRRRVEEGFRARGFSYVALDLRGYRTGSLNEGIGGGGE